MPSPPLLAPALLLVFSLPLPLPLDDPDPEPDAGVGAAVWTAAALEVTARWSSVLTAARFFTASSDPAFWFAATAAGKSFWSCWTCESIWDSVAVVSMSDGVNTLEFVSVCWTAKQPPVEKAGRSVSWDSQIL